MTTVEDFYVFFEDFNLYGKDESYYRAVLAHLLTVVPLPEIGMQLLEEKASELREKKNRFVSMIDELISIPEVQEFIDDQIMENGNIHIQIEDAIDELED